MRGRDGHQRASLRKAPFISPVANLSSRIYGEIGPGERVALAKLSVEKLEATGRPLRIAIDISIWLIEVQLGQGGSNPALRTLYYRLLRLLALSIQPLFVFDGPRRPAFKRGRQINTEGSLSTHHTLKQLLGLLGFPYHVAPGEAEAECASLQRAGVVDAVMSEDVDTLMFGCTLSMRNWSAEGRANKTPTHVSVYRADEIKKGKSGLDREGMVLIALMSGGDYEMTAIPGCGPKVAAEAARAGFGASLCQLPSSDEAARAKWKETLSHELCTNQSKFFRTKHSALQLPESFPDIVILSHYTDPLISSRDEVEQLKARLQWNTDVEVPSLLSFTSKTFSWTGELGARKMIRSLAPALLTHRLCRQTTARREKDGRKSATRPDGGIVRAILGKRVHFSTDGIEELRISYVPLDLAGLSQELEQLEQESKDDPAVSAEVEPQSAAEGLGDISILTPVEGGSKPRATPLYDPRAPEKIWLPGCFVRMGGLSEVQAWEEALRKPSPTKKKTTGPKRTTRNGGMQRGAMDRYVKVTKPFIDPLEIRAVKKPSESVNVSCTAPLLPNDAEDRQDSIHAITSRINIQVAPKDSIALVSQGPEESVVPPRAISKASEESGAGTGFRLPSNRGILPSTRCEKVVQQSKTEPIKRKTHPSRALSHSIDSEARGEMPAEPCGPERRSEELPESPKKKRSPGKKPTSTKERQRNVPPTSPTKRRSPRLALGQGRVAQDDQFTSSTTPSKAPMISPLLSSSPLARRDQGPIELVSSSPSLPSPSQLLTPARRPVKGGRQEIIDISSSPLQILPVSTRAHVSSDGVFPETPDAELSLPGDTRLRRRGRKIAPSRAKGNGSEKGEVLDLTQS